MTYLEIFFLIQLGVQILHSLEELTQGFHKNNFLFPMSFKTFLSFEILFTILIMSIFFLPINMLREILMHIFLILMFANGIWHIIWARVVKRYVPGLFTAPLHLIVFLVFYFFKFL